MENQKKRVHLICNAHIDPTWQWEWEEGAAEAISTFRIAAQFCEDFDDYVFCHNEAILYKWVEEYEPALFTKIQELVKKGKWHIMCGWHIQPDCNMPSGEGFVRQSVYGRNYFYDNFGVKPTTAINFDSFGHTRGLVQILAKSGYDSYIFTRPDASYCPLPSDFFRWIGYDGSSVVGYRAREGYGNNLGQAVEKIKNTIALRKDDSLCMCLWGMGNHGGGPSRRDLENIAVFQKEMAEQGIEVIHSNPETFFQELKESGRELPEHKGDLNLWSPGCYTSQIRIKQKYRQMENTYFMTEKMCSMASVQGLMKYPKQELNDATYDLLTAQFHDYLPGSSVQPVEEMGVRKLDHGLEILSNVKARAFIALSQGQTVATLDEIPILVFNPHPYPIEDDFECEFMLWYQNWEKPFHMPKVLDEAGNQIPTQPEKENSTIPLDWRKRVVFHATIPAMQMARFNCKFDMTDGVYHKPIPTMPSSTNHYIFDNATTHIEINKSTGLLDKYVVNGKNYLQTGAFTLDVIKDNYDPWGMTVTEFRDKIGEFTLLSEKEGSIFSGIEDAVIPSVRVIESGAVRTVVEAVFGYNLSRAVVRYKMSQTSAAMDIEIRIQMNEKQRMIKLAIPSFFAKPECLGQVAYGVENLPVTGRENVSQKYLIFKNEEKDAFSILNDGVYGSSVEGNTLKLTLLRTPSYTAHPLGDRVTMPPDRFSPYCDIGERLYNFRFYAGNADEISEKIGREALCFSEKPMTLSFYPCGAGEKPQSAVVLEGDACIEMTTLKKAEKEESFILRLFNPLGVDKTAIVKMPVLGIEGAFTVPAYEFISLKAKDGVIHECTLMEEDC